MAGAPCATTRRKACAYRKHAPRTHNGQLAWSVFQQESWRLRIAGMGVVSGIDSGPALRALERAGVAAEDAEQLLGACERGMVLALNQKDEDDGGQD